MLDESGSVPPAGWFTDPLDANRQRWWNGTGWTDRVLPEESSGFRVTIAEASPPFGHQGHPMQPIVIAPSEPDPNPLESSPPLTRRELRKRVGRLTYERERWRPESADLDGRPAAH